MKSFCLLDFETESTCDLKKAGAWVYAADPTTNIICLGFTIGGEKPFVWEPTEYRTDYRDPPYGHQAFLALRSAVEDPDVIFIAHNAAFEKAIWRHVMVAVLGWPDIPNDRWHDIMATCAMKALPLKLERAALALRLSNQKDTEGTKATLALGRVVKKGKNKGYYDRSPEKLARVFAYNKQDILAELDLHRRVRGLGAEERRVWLLDQTINERGIRLDMAYVNAAQSICDQAAKPLWLEFERLTGGIEPTQDKRFKDWLVQQGCPFPRDEDGKPMVNLQKETVLKLLGDEDEDEDQSLAGEADDYHCEEPQSPLPFAYRRPLEIRKILGSASIKKLAAMQACCGPDGRARGLLQYHGAGPGRWAGRLLQPQNFPRPTLKVSEGFDKDGRELFKGHDTEQLVDAIMTGDAEYVRLLFGEPISAVSNGLRHAIVASPGNLLEVGDFATIEARIVLAIAGQHDKTEIMAAGKDIYIDMAQAIYHVPVDKKRDPEKRQIGKNSVLGCGFQMGWRKFKKRYAPNETDEFCQACISAYREDFAPEVPKLWRALEEAATRTVWDRVGHEAYGIAYNLEDGFLTCRLPSGRKLWYYDPKPVRKKMPWDENDIRPGFEYSAWKIGRWKRISAYGGLLTENVVQATARDLLVNGMFNTEAAEHPLVLTVHDEEIADVPEALADAKVLDGFMCDVPEWAKRLQIPVATDCWVGERYRK